MTDQTRVILLTGFLGSGKTSLLNRIIQAIPANVRALILMNEFGEIGVDGLIVRTEDLEMIEINRGSIFCACVKTDFIKALVDIQTRIQPDLLIIEATGVADPRDLRRTLELSVFKGRFKFAEQFCLIDALNFIDVYEVFVSIEEQLKSSTKFLINKTDLVVPSEIQAILEIIGKHHPEPVYETTTFGRIPDSWLADLPFEAQGATRKPVAELDAVVVDRLVEAALADPEAPAMPPDRLASAIYAWQGGRAKDLTALAKELPAELLRIKGFVSLGGRVHLFSRALKHQEILPFETEDDLSGVTDRLVFIARPEALERLAAQFKNDPRLNLQSSLDQISDILLGDLA